MNTQPERNEDEMAEVEGYGGVINIPPGTVGTAGPTLNIPPGTVGQDTTITISPAPVSGTMAPLGGGGGSMFNPTPVHHLFSVRI